jgi:hypothetical protein
LILTRLPLVRITNGDLSGLPVATRPNVLAHCAGLAGWAIGVTWLGVTTTAFQLSRHVSGQQITDPVTEGLAPEEGTELRPGMPGQSGNVRLRAVALLLASWVLTIGLVIGLGEIVTTFGNGNQLGDLAVPHWLAAHRTPGLTRVSLIFTDLGSTVPILVVAFGACLVFIAATRNWRPVVYLAVVMAGELGAFLLAAEVIKRPRPFVAHLPPARRGLPPVPGRAPPDRPRGQRPALRAVAHGGHENSPFTGHDDAGSRNQVSRTRAELPLAG